MSAPPRQARPPAALHMVSVQFAVGPARAFARSQGVPPDDCDDGYLAHLAFTESFGRDWAPRPFHMKPSGGDPDVLDLYGYARADAARMRLHADTFAPPELHGAFRWDTFASKRMPSQWPRGQELGFELRACPTQRTTTPGLGREADVFIEAVRAASPGARLREVDVYGAWLAERLARDQAADLVSVGVVERTRATVLRRTHSAQRESRVVSLPEVLFRGVLRVHSSDAFNDALGAGVGRQNGFGFGMVLLRPTRDSLLPSRHPVYSPKPGRFATVVALG